MPGGIKMCVRSGSLLMLIILCLGGCSDSSAPTGPEDLSTARPGPLRIVAINGPLAYIAGRLGGDLVNVDVLVRSDIDPALWLPEADDVLAMQAADLIVLNGAGYEPWRQRVSLPDARVLSTAESLSDQLIRSATITHQHGPEGAHSHAETAFTLWLDPLLMLEQARSVAAAISAGRPADRDAIGQRFNHLEADLRQLHESWVQATARLDASPVLFSHPVYQYFERRYQLNGHSVHWEPGEDPGESEWMDLAGLLESHPASLMIWEAQPLPDTRQRLADLGVASVVLDPAAGADAAEDFLDRQQANVERFRAALDSL